RVRSSVALLASHTFAVWSPTARTRGASGLNDAEGTKPVCPLRVRSSTPLLASHTFAVWPPPVTIRDQAGVKDASDARSESAALRVRSSTPLLASHTFAVWFPSSVTTRVPSGLNDAEVT